MRSRRGAAFRSSGRDMKGAGRLDLYQVRGRCEHHIPLLRGNLEINASA